MSVPIPTRVRSLFVASAVLLTTVLAQTRPANAFKLKIHILIANQAAGQVYGPNANAIVSFPSLGTVSVQNPDVVRVIRDNMAAFRAGVLGPDVFPDLYGGQMWVHIDRGNPKGLDREGCKADRDGCVFGDVSFEMRAPFKQWRSIDYGMFLLKRAQDYHAEGAASRDSAIAFAYGYLAHMSADGFAHSYVNEWARSKFDLTKGHPGALYGPFTEELQHLAVEGFLDAHIPKMDAESLQIDPPLGFLNQLFSDAHGPSHGLREPTAAGAFGGVYFEKLVKARAKMLALSDEKKWDPTGVGEAIRGFATFGTGIGDPVKDISSYFRQRYEIINAALFGWTKLSKCVAQNLILGANQGPTEELKVDACASTNFEEDSATAALFDGKLNAAGRLGQFEAHPDFGRTASNMAKQRAFVSTVLNRAFVFNPTEDIASLKKIKTAIENCEGRLVKWGSCENACSAAEKTCSGIVRAVSCPGCPTNCKGFKNKILCTMPHCWPCIAGLTEIVADEVCSANVRAAIPVCHLCQPNPVCESLQRLEQGRKQFALFQKNVIEKVITPLIDEVQKDLIQYYVGPYAKEMYDLYQVFEERRVNSGPAWFVNLAFLREDFKREPAFLNDVVSKMAQVAGVAVDTGVSVAEAVASTYQKTRGSGRSALDKIVATPGGSLDTLWHSMVDGIVSIARDPNFDASRDMNSNRFTALDQFMFTESDKTYESRFSKFVALLSKLGALTDMRGPTARALRASMSLDSGAIDSNAGSTFFSPASFEPVYNAIALTKLGFLGKAGLASLGSLGGVTFPTGQPFGFTAEAYSLAGHQPSSICSEMSHPLCDSIQSLDDPNHYGNRLAAGSAANGGTALDANRSVAIMESQVDAQSPSDCVPGLSDFILSGTPESVRKLYERVFLMPKRCAPDLTVDMLPTLDGVPVVVAPGGIARASAGQSINWVVRVRNVGLSPSMQSSVNLDINGSVFGRYAVPPLQPSGEQRFNAVLKTSTLGTLRATAAVDPDKQLVELKEDNNSSQFILHVH